MVENAGKRRSGTAGAVTSGFRPAVSVAFARPHCHSPTYSIQWGGGRGGRQATTSGLCGYAHLRSFAGSSPGFAGSKLGWGSFEGRDQVGLGGWPGIHHRGR